MKKNLLLILLVLTSSVITHAQISKGSLFLGGQLNYTKDVRASSFPNDTYDRYNLSIYPAIGTAIQENLVAGFDIVFGKVRANYSTSKYKERNAGGGIFIRKYFPIINRLYFFSQGRAGVTFQKISDNDQNLKGYNIALGFYPGLSFAINRRLQLESGFNNLAYASYSHAKSRGPAANMVETDRYTIGSDLGNPFTFTLGVRLLFNKQP